MKYFRKKYLNLIVFALAALLAALSISCSSNSATSTSKTTVSTVQKGNVTIQVTGTGNLALQTKQDLAFEMAGTVSEVLVDVSATVKKGDKLAVLDTTDFENQLKTLQKNVTTATRNLTTAQRSVETAKSNVTSAQDNIVKVQRQIAAKELAVDSAKLDVQSAQNNLSNLNDVKKAQDVVTSAQNDLDTAYNNIQQANISGNSALAVNLNNLIPTLRANLSQAQKDLNSLLGGTSLNTSSDVVLAISKAQLAITQAQNNVVSAQNALDDANQAVTDAQDAIKDVEASVTDAQTNQSDAEQAVADAQAALNDAKALSPVIVAPIDGIITKVNVQGGDEIQKGTVALQIADPTQFAANILVTETDVFSVQVGGDATVSLEALSGVTFPAKVTAIAPTATVQSGVVNYSVTVKLISSQTAAASKGSGTSLAANLSSTSAQATSLKDGLSAVVNILVQSRNNVLMVPNRAITRQGQTTTVQVVSGKTTETRTVTTGLSDSSNTEITEGLSEGEQVLIKSSTSTSSTSTTSNNLNQGPGGPGIGGIPLP
jgi:HlyD family secretion protein